MSSGGATSNAEAPTWVARVPLLPAYGWHPLPHGDVKIEFTRARDTITGAVVSELDYDHTYKHRVRAKRGSQSPGGWRSRRRCHFPNWACNQKAALGC